MDSLCFQLHADNLCFHSGVFELNFRDERYLPFEGAGAISTWQIELPPDTNQFDLNTITDVIIHLKYTARDGGSALAREARRARSVRGVRLFSARHEFSTGWHRFLHSPSQGGRQSLSLDLSRERFPAPTRGKAALKIVSVGVFFKWKDVPLAAGQDAPRTTYENSVGSKPLMAKVGPVNKQTGLLVEPAPPGKALNLTGDLPLHEFKEKGSHLLNDLPPRNTFDGFANPFNQDVWRLLVATDVDPRLLVSEAGGDGLNPEAVEDIWLVVVYEAS